VRVVTVGTAIWLVLLVCLLPFTSRLRSDGRLWWIAACAVGAGLGVLGVAFLRRRRARLAQPASQRSASPPSTTQTSPVT